MLPLKIVKIGELHTTLVSIVDGEIIEETGTGLVYFPNDSVVNLNDYQLSLMIGQKLKGREARRFAISYSLFGVSADGKGLIFEYDINSWEKELDFINLH